MRITGEGKRLPTELESFCHAKGKRNAVNIHLSTVVPTKHGRNIVNWRGRSEGSILYSLAVFHQASARCRMVTLVSILRLKWLEMLQSYSFV